MKSGIRTGSAYKKVKQKCRDTRGETLAEVLVGILFVALASSLFLSMVTVSQNINANTQKADDTFYKAMSQLKCMEADGAVVQKKNGTVRVTIGEDGSISQDYGVTVYYGDDMMAYRSGGEPEEEK